MSLAEPFAVLEYFVEGFDDFEVKDGIMSCAVFRTQHGERVAIVRLVIPVSGIAESLARQSTAIALAEPGATLVLRKVGRHLS